MWKKCRRKVTTCDLRLPQSQGGLCGCQGGVHGCQGGMRGCQGGMRGCWGGMCGCQMRACMVARGGVCGCWGGMHGCRGACMAAGGHVWLPGGMCGCRGGMRGCRGVCVVAGGHAWLLGGCHVTYPIMHFDVTCMLSPHQLRASSYAPAYILVGHVTRTPPHCGQTDTCKNITFANFVCGR